MLQAATLKFLTDLKKNNHKEWFEANRKRYDAAKADFTEMVAKILKAMESEDEAISRLQPKDCMFRINRDVRFSKEKHPYKTNMAMYISPTGKNTVFGGYYLHVEPGKPFVAGGIWMPMAPELKKIRQEIDYNLEDFKAIVENTAFKKKFGELDRSEGFFLQRPPKGYEAVNPAIEYLKLKSFIATHTITNDDLLSPDAVKKITASFKSMTPFIKFLNQAIG